MAINTDKRDVMSAYEREQFEQEKTVTELQIDHLQRLKDKEIELAKLEAKWSSWLRIPITILKLPVAVLLGIAYICSMFTKKDVGEEFWKFLK